MAGSLGYASNHYHLSMAIGELALFPAGIKAVNHFGERTICTTAGISSQAQIADGKGFQAIYLIQLISQYQSQLISRGIDIDIIFINSLNSFVILTWIECKYVITSY